MLLWVKCVAQREKRNFGSSSGRLLFFSLIAPFYLFGLFIFLHRVDSTVKGWVGPVISCGSLKQVVGEAPTAGSGICAPAQTRLVVARGVAGGLRRPKVGLRAACGGGEAGLGGEAGGAAHRPWWWGRTPPLVVETHTAPGAA